MLWLLCRRALSDIKDLYVHILEDDLSKSAFDKVCYLSLKVNPDYSSRSLCEIETGNFAFIKPIPPCRNVLADVFPIPRDVFGLEDLIGVLSYEVWETQLSETEKSFLYQFLPEGTDAKEVVQALLKRESLHFGNPFMFMF
ncbi:hypothetical protein IFM89_012628 [Coptis chinensis]|uniref:Uncharacterized protein n=1 Tax=Coptis chinensis TaxID=261450 RepID=A0A835IMI1_9MAGN|nr:hypothetical protein IFM89_012628 [Coptis chinensis]